MLTAGTLPGVVAGSVIRARQIPGPRVFDVVIAAVLIPLGTWLVLSRPARGGQPDRPARMIPAPALVVLAIAVGCVGGIYGIGGAILIGTGPKPSEVAPAILSLNQHLSVAPDWPTGVALGLGGLAGRYTGAPAFSPGCPMS